MSYKQARIDFEFLESIEEIRDTVEQMSRLTEFMENPNKAFAEGLYIDMILQWFSEREAEEVGIMYKGKRLELKLFRRVLRIQKKY